MARPKGKGRITTSVTVSPEFFLLAKEHHISFTEAIRVGIAMELAELGLKEYDNKLNLYRKMQFFKDKAEQSLQKLEELEKKNAEL
jgi:hypothetical protein